MIQNSTKFAVVRYGNVAGSRGSIIPFFLGLKNECSPITDKNMTRFLIKYDDAIELVMHSIIDMEEVKFMLKKYPQ